MRLVDLEPRYYRVGDNPKPVGITFNCPHCPETGQRLAIAIHLDGTNFDPDPDNLQQFAAGETIWNITSGDSFENLSLTPSIDASQHGHWHGFITTGEAK